MLQEFRTFIARGNVLDLAVAVVIGAAFGTIVTALTEDMIMPVIGAITGGVDFSRYFVMMGPVPADFAGSTSDYEALKKAGVPLLGFGKFLTAVINFLIIAIVIFLLVKVANRAMNVTAPPPAGPTPSEVLLADILAELKARPLAPAAPSLDKP